MGEVLEFPKWTGLTVICGVCGVNQTLRKEDGERIGECSCIDGKRFYVPCDSCRADIHFVVPTERKDL